MGSCVCVVSVCVSRCCHMCSCVEVLCAQRCMHLSYIVQACLQQEQKMGWDICIVILH